MTKRFRGMWQVVRFNPWFYLGSGVMLLLGIGALTWMWPVLHPFLRVGGTVGLALAGWWFLASLVVSHWVYDLSDWSKGQWCRKLRMGGRILNVHSGFDETTERLRRWEPTADVDALDLFDPERLTETSIHRARRYLPPLPGTAVGSPELWPAELHHFDCVCFLLSAHEFRHHSERVALLQRAREALAPGGRVVLAEHVRDVANFIAFGPGFMHFHSVKSWQQAWTEADLVAEKALRVTPFVRIWPLRSASH